jgi:hypothetical protein
MVIGEDDADKHTRETEYKTRAGSAHGRTIRR